MKSIEQNYEDFISTVSHELRTPLTSIRGFSQTMLSSWDKLDDESKKKFIKIIEEQSNRLIHLVENMLQVSKLQNPKTNLCYCDINLKAITEQIITIVKPQYPAQVFETTISPENLNVFLDKDKFQQILTNLIENSAKYSTSDNKTKIDAKLSDNNVVITVSNTGLNISSEDKEKIFTKFARIDNPLTRKVQGSGLGLYITKTLVEKMNGTIEVQSIPIENDNGLAKIDFILKFPILDIEEKARLKCNQ